MRLLLLSFVLILVLLVHPAPAWARPITIVAFGDSLTAGYGLAPHEAFPAQLEARLKADGYDVTVINEGVSGDTTADGVTRLSQVLAHKPDLVILALGANDMLGQAQPATTRANLEAIIQTLQAAQVNILMAGIDMPLVWNISAPAAWDDLYEDIADHYELELYENFLEGVGGDPRLNLPDRIHPNAHGISVIVDGIYPFVEDFLD